MKTLEHLKHLLLNTHTFDFQATTTMGTKGWQGKGFGNVKVEQLTENVIIFHEAGKFLMQEKKEIKCYNTYRWTFEIESVKLEHLRFGNQNPVYLFNLVCLHENQLASACAHVCDKDLYTAELFLVENKICLSWRMQGEEKDEKIIYTYQSLL